jgi:hypothetical protein
MVVLQTPKIIFILLTTHIKFYIFIKYFADNPSESVASGPKNNHGISHIVIPWLGRGCVIYTRIWCAFELFYVRLGDD